MQGHLGGQTVYPPSCVRSHIFAKEEHPSQILFCFVFVEHSVGRAAGAQLERIKLERWQHGTLVKHFLRGRV